MGGRTPLNGGNSIILPLCFLLLHFEEDEVVFGSSSSSAIGLVGFIWWLDEVLELDLFHVGEQLRCDFVGQDLLDAPDMIGETSSQSGRLA